MTSSPPLLELSIRSAMASDHGNLQQLAIASLQAQATPRYRPDELDALMAAKHAADYSFWGDRIWIAEVEGAQSLDGGTPALVGFAACHTKLSQVTITALYVHPSWLRRGIGRQLLEQVEAFATQNRFRYVIVKASLNGSDFYAACGYRPQAIQSQVEVMGRPVRCVEMGKVVDRNSPLFWLPWKHQ